MTIGNRLLAVFWLIWLAAGIAWFVTRSQWPITYSALFLISWAVLALMMANKRSNSAHEASNDSADSNEDNASPMTSIVLLLDAYRELDVAEISQKIESAWNIRIDNDSKDSTAFVVGESEHFIVQTPRGHFILHNIPQPYFEQDLIDDMRELRQKRVVERCQAWLSFDALACDESDDRAAIYAELARVVGQFIDGRCLALFKPETSQLVPFEDEMAESLKQGKPSAVFDESHQVPVVNIAGDDPRLVAAVAEAKRRWPEFVKAFESRKADEPFSVKAEFREGDVSEFMWMEVTAMEGDKVYGKLGNEPVDIKRIKCGDAVTVRAQAVTDWLCMDGGEPRGGFTVKVLMDSAKEDRID